MRICPSCGHENPNTHDFCECGEYLNWEPTSHITAVKRARSKPEREAKARAPGAPRADPAHDAVDPDLTLAPGRSNARAEGNGPLTPEGVASTAAERDLSQGAATLLLRLPDDQGPATGVLRLAVRPGEKVTLLGLIRNDSEIVDNYDLSVAGLPDGWWTVTPATAYLNPLQGGQNYEQEIQVHVHPPRSHEAQAKEWPFEVVAASRASEKQVAAAAAAVTIEPYQDVVAKLAPDRASGRLRARFVLTVRNRANAPADVLVSATDADGACRFRFAQPSLAVDPGAAVEAPFTVFPPKQIWIGRANDRQIDVTATPDGADQPGPAMKSTFRQLPWLPWWLSVVVPIIAGLVALFILLQPKEAVVPNLKTAQSIFAAQKLLVARGLVLSPQVRAQTLQSAVPGQIVDQAPRPGAKVKRGTAVVIAVDVASATVKVPKLVGLTPVAADTTLRGSELTLGAVSPRPDPNGQIASQIPAADLRVKKGTPIAVFLRPPSPAAGGATTGTGTTGASGKSGGGAGTAGKAIVVPAISGDPIRAAQQLSQRGFVPSRTSQFDSRPKGTLIGTNPPRGAPLAVGSSVTLLVSAGYPQLSYDDGTRVHVVDGATGAEKVTVPSPPAAAQQWEASWSADGNSLVYAQGGRLMLLSLNRKGAQPRPLTGAGSDDHDPSFAPANGNRLAFIEGPRGHRRLCFAVVGPNPLNPDCVGHPGLDLARQIAWSPDGLRLLVYGQKVGDNQTFGLIEFLSNVRYSTHAADWGHGTVVTDMSRRGQGVIAGAYSPNGKQLALVSNIGNGDFYLFLAPSDDFKFDQRAKATAYFACEVAWRPDGRQLAINESDGACATYTGRIVPVDPLKLNTPMAPIATHAEHPAWQPLAVNG